LFDSTISESLCEIIIINAKAPSTAELMPMSLIASPSRKMAMRMPQIIIKIA
jgi:hypothetical protein